MKFLEELAARRRFGAKPGLETISTVLERLGNPHRRIKAVHIAGTNGKGATAAIIDACLRTAGLRVARYTSPHLVRINERFFIDGDPIDDEILESAASRVFEVAMPDMTFFEALTAIAFLVFAESNIDCAVLETGLGGRLDATNVCRPVLSIITRIGLDHCDWLGDTIVEIAGEKAGIVKSGVPVVLGANEQCVREVVRARAEELDSQFIYAPDVASEADIPINFPLGGMFNRENAVTSLAALQALSKTFPLGQHSPSSLFSAACGGIVWPGRFQRVGRFIIDGAHNPPAASALVCALQSEISRGAIVAPGGRLTLIAGFCADKDVASVLAILKPIVAKAFAVRTSNPRSLPADDLAAIMHSAGIAATPCVSLDDAISRSHGTTLICGSLFLAADALVALDAYPWPTNRTDPNEML